MDRTACQMQSACGSFALVRVPFVNDIDVLINTFRRRAEFQKLNGEMNGCSPSVEHYHMI